MPLIDFAILSLTGASLVCPFPAHVRSTCHYLGLHHLHLLGYFTCQQWTFEKHGELRATDPNLHFDCLRSHVWPLRLDGDLNLRSLPHNTDYMAMYYVFTSHCYRSQYVLRLQSTEYCEFPFFQTFHPSPATRMGRAKFFCQFLVLK